MHLFVTKRKEDLAYVDSLMNICPSPHPHSKLTKTLWLASTHFPTLTFMHDLEVKCARQSGKCFLY